MHPSRNGRVSTLLNLDRVLHPWVFSLFQDHFLERQSEAALFRTDRSFHYAVA